MNTVIGTPPNIIIAQYRQEYTGVAFNFLIIHLSGWLLVF